MTQLLRNYASKYHGKTYLYSIGQSVQGRELWVLALADSRPNAHVLGRPEVKYVGGIHGDCSRTFLVVSGNAFS